MPWTQIAENNTYASNAQWIWIVYVWEYFQKVKRIDTAYFYIIPPTIANISSNAADLTFLSLLHLRTHPHTHAHTQLGSSERPLLAGAGHWPLGRFNIYGSLQRFTIPAWQKWSTSQVLCLSIRQLCTSCRLPSQSALQDVCHWLTSRGCQEVAHKNGPVGWRCLSLISPDLSRCACMHIHTKNIQDKFGTHVCQTAATVLFYTYTQVADACAGLRM